MNEITPNKQKKTLSRNLLTSTFYYSGHALLLYYSICTNRLILTSIELCFSCGRYLAMSVMTFSSMVEADRRMRLFKEHVRDEERLAREEERGKAWARYFEEVEGDAD